LIIDTSALVAAIHTEEGSGPIRVALSNEAASALIPAPVLVELNRVTSLDGNKPSPATEALVSLLLEKGTIVVPFDNNMAVTAAEANTRYGTGNGRGGSLNMLDLMVYAAAKIHGLPILCTGKDFLATDAMIHPASRPV
jgi:ribonuclease VapC